MTAPRDNSPQPAPDHSDEAIPLSLAAELSRLSSPGRLAVPPGFDDDILSMARARLRPRPISRLLLRVGTGLAAAAALGLVTWLAWPSGRVGTNGLALAALDPAKHIDIVDAFSLARQLRAGRTPDVSWDVTGDGTIDQQDVDRLKAMAVRLVGSGGGGT